MSRNFIFETERLVVTTWLARDVDELLVVHSDEETMRFVRQGRPETRAETADLVDQYVAEHTFNGFTKWRLTDLHSQLIGRAGFGTHEGIQGRELAYTIRRDRWGQGLATEVGAALVRWHMTNAPDSSLYAYVAVENPASRRVLDKIGFSYVRSEDHYGVPCELFTWA
ncbi:MAG: GNAT family N-acetyltransferase [Actinomycetota bacterium]|nr:GNAT family N-acetyltransferase [Actinomycetota bacterium]